jgi:hypothetical protein
MFVTFPYFAVQLLILAYFNKSAIATGAVSLTCDAWQASNTDGYFAVTGHWIEEPREGEWIEEEALFGFALMNTAHNGIRLSQALYRICNRLGIVYKVCLSPLLLFSYDVIILGLGRAYYLRQRGK